MNWLDRSRWTPDAREALGAGLPGAVLAGTGHRPPRLGLDYSPAANERLTRFVRDWLAGLPAAPGLVVSGGAQGFDQALAHAAHLLGLPYWVAVPFDAQDARWPPEARARYASLLHHAARVVTVCPPGYHPQKFIARDRFMADLCASAVCLWDGAEAGGTWETVSYVRSLNKPIENLWGRWGSSP